MYLYLHQMQVSVCTHPVSCTIQLFQEDTISQIHFWWFHCAHCVWTDSRDESCSLSDTKCWCFTESKTHTIFDFIYLNFLSWSNHQLCSTKVHPLDGDSGLKNERCLTQQLSNHFSKRTYRNKFFYCNLVTSLLSHQKSSISFLWQNIKFLASKTTVQLLE